jgi:hypothetical protein
MGTGCPKYIKKKKVMGINVTITKEKHFQAVYTRYYQA